MEVVTVGHTEKAANRNGWPVVEAEIQQSDLTGEAFVELYQLLASHLEGQLPHVPFVNILLSKAAHVESVTFPDLKEVQQVLQSLEAQYVMEHTRFLVLAGMKNKLINMTMNAIGYWAQVEVTSVGTEEEAWNFLDQDLFPQK